MKIAILLTVNQLLNTFTYLNLFWLNNFGAQFARLLGEILSQYKLWIFKMHCPLPICLLFTLEHCLLYQENNVFIAFIKVIVDITMTPFSVVG